MVLPPYNIPYVQQVILCMSDSDALITLFIYLEEINSSSFEYFF